ncbi:MAG TPA: MFS transporter [Solirubrobacteraceae bacterium]|nr:MFS transporter [Solirubrobacteraceae bacterium]
MCLTQFMVILDVSIVNVALPSIQTGLHFGTTGLQWVVNAYTITFGGFLLLGGRAADLLGRRRVFLVGTALFSVSSLLCAFAGSRGLMIGARALQGLGGAVLSPASLSIITTSFAEGSERNRALGVWGAMAGLGGASGVLFGGILTQVFGWPAIFVINAPIGLAVIVVGRGVIPESRRDDLRRDFDLAGAILVTLGLVAVVCGIVRSESLGWGSIGVLGSIALGIALLGAFALVEGRLAAAPLLPLGVLRMRRLRAANLVIALLYAGVFSMWFFLSLFLQGVLGYSALKAGLAFLPITLSVALAATFTPRLVARTGACRVIAAGMLSSAVGLALLSRVSPSASYAAVVLPGGVIAGAGLGMTVVPLTIIAVQGVSPAQSGLASGLINTSRLVGGALGLAVLSTLADSHTASKLASGASRLTALASGYQLAFALSAAICLLGTFLSVFLLRPDPSDIASVARGREARWAAWTCGRIDAPQKPPDPIAPEPS